MTCGAAEARSCAFTRSAAFMSQQCVSELCRCAFRRRAAAKRVRCGHSCRRRLGSSRVKRGRGAIIWSERRKKENGVRGAEPKNATSFLLPTNGRLEVADPEVRGTRPNLTARSAGALIINIIRNEYRRRARRALLLLTASDWCWSLQPRSIGEQLEVAHPRPHWQRRRPMLLP